MDLCTLVLVDKFEKLINLFFFDTPYIIVDGVDQSHSRKVADSDAAHKGLYYYCYYYYDYYYDYCY